MLSKNIKYLLESMERDTRKHGVQITRVGVQSLLSLADEDDIVGHSTLQELRQEFSGCPDIISDKSVDVELGKVVDEEVYSAEKQVACIAIAKATLERHRALISKFCNLFYQFQQYLRLSRQRSIVARSRL